MWRRIGDDDRLSSRRSSPISISDDGRPVVDFVDRSLSHNETTTTISSYDRLFNRRLSEAGAYERKCWEGGARQSHNGSMMMVMPIAVSQEFDMNRKTRRLLTSVTANKIVNCEFLRSTSARIVCVFFGLLITFIICMRMYFDQANLIRYLGTYWTESDSITTCGMPVREFTSSLELSHPPLSTSINTPKDIQQNLNDRYSSGAGINAYDNQQHNDNSDLSAAIATTGVHYSVTPRQSITVDNDITDTKPSNSEFLPHSPTDFLQSNSTLSNNDSNALKSTTNLTPSAINRLNYPLTFYWKPQIPIATLSKLKSCLIPSTSSIDWFYSMINNPMSCPKASPSAPIKTSFPSLSLWSSWFFTKKNVKNTNADQLTPDASLNSSERFRSHSIKPSQIPFFPWTTLERWRGIESTFPLPQCEEFEWALSSSIYNDAMELWSQFIWIASEMNLTWFGEAGSVIGSIRHWDVIPWDDDIDIRMMEDDWSRLHQRISDGDFPTLESSNMALSSSKGKIWLKRSTTSEAAFRPWKFPFLDVWGIKEVSIASSTSKGEDEVPMYQLVDPPHSLLDYHTIFPLHYRPLGPFWIPFVHRPFELLRRKDFPKVPYPELPPIIDECKSREYDHNKEVWRMFRQSAACLTLAPYIPLVTRRYSRASCPYSESSSTIGAFFDSLISNRKSDSRLLDCLGIPRHSKTIVVNQDPAAIGTTILPHTLSNGRASPQREQDTFNVDDKLDLPDWWKLWDLQSIAEKSWRIKSDGNGTVDIPSNWPVLFVWECPKPIENYRKEQLLTEGIIEVLSIGGIPLGIVEICSGDYTLVQKDPVIQQ